VRPFYDSRLALREVPESGTGPTGGCHLAQYRVLPQELLPVSGLFGGAPAGRTRGFVYWAPAQLHVGIPKLIMGDLRDRESRRPCGIYAAGTGLVGHPQVAHYIGLLSEIRTCSRQSLWSPGTSCCREYIRRSPLHWAAR